MLKLKDYKRNFHHHDVPEVLARLLEFQNQTGVPFCQGFQLTIDDRSRLMALSEKRECQDALCPLGTASSQGATYVLWTRESVKEVGECPVLAFGADGSVHVVVETPLHLLRVLSLDAEPMIDRESLIFMKDEGQPPSPGASAYAAWLKQHYHQRPVKDVAEVELMVRSAESYLEKPLQTWLEHFRHRNGP